MVSWRASLPSVSTPCRISAIAQNSRFYRIFGQPLGLIGEVHHGGYAERACVKGDWLILLPENISTASAMAIGTAGYTAMLCVLALEDAGVTPDKRDVLVTGAAGGVSGTGPGRRFASFLRANKLR